MNKKTEVLISIAFNILTLGVFYIGVTTHREMTKEDYYVKKLKCASFAELKEKMLSVSWRYDFSYPGSLFDGQENYFHAGIYRFKDVGYLMTTYGYLKSKRLQKEIRKTFTGSYSPKPYID